eukprot:8312630-Pyramimonas_sp.AAC.1
MSLYAFTARWHAWSGPESLRFRAAYLITSVLVIPHHSACSFLARALSGVERTSFQQQAAPRARP